MLYFFFPEVKLRTLLAPGTSKFLLFIGFVVFYEEKLHPSLSFLWGCFSIVAGSDKVRSWKKGFEISDQGMEDIDMAISTLQELIRCPDRDEERKSKRKFEELAGSTAKESLNSEGVPSIYKLNEETKALAQKMEKLLNRGIFSEGISLDVFEEKRGLVLPTSKLAGETTAIKNMEKIYDFINGNVRKIGVYGMGGIGKTTVMKHINNRILKERKDKFDCVIWVTVSKDSCVFKLQDDIGCKLEINLSNYKDTTTRAGILCEAFEKKGRYLLILDDLWEGYPLEDVGIPDPDDPTSSNGCKLVLTTRLRKVCQVMKCEAIKMSLLSEEEAWSLFLDHVGRDVLQVKDLEPIMRDVASECACLPLAIATIATSMRGEKDACEWRVALTKLRAFSEKPSDMGRRVIEQLKFSYDRLESKKLQQCLLLCALYPEDKNIERRELVELLALEGIVEEKEFMRDEIDEGHAMLNNLINQCLLEGVRTWVKMHDLVRDMALQIDNLHSQYQAMSGNAFRELENVKWSEDLLKIHISYCDFLHASPVCPRLTTFILQDHSLIKIIDSFFQHFKALKVLNLSGCRSLLVLPNSISDLVNLVGLLLRDCDSLSYVPPLGRLKNLRNLDFSSTIINYSLIILTTLPKELKELSSLRYLKLTSTPIKVFPPGIIARLCRLRYLACSPFTKVSASELMGLKNLEMFMGTFHSIYDLSVYVKHRERKRSRLSSYTFLVGFTLEDLCLYNDLVRNISVDKVVKLVNCNAGEASSENDVFLLPKDVQMLQIVNGPDLTSLSAMTSLIYATDLQICEIKNCSGLTEFVSSSFALQGLERLQLENLKNLKALIGGKKESCNVFPCLRELHIVDCPRIRVLFNIGLFFNLNKLEVLIVRECQELEEIMGESLDSDEHLYEGIAEVSLPKLKSLRLSNLPSLKSICPARAPLICESLHEIDIDSCSALEQFLYAPPDNRGQPSSLTALGLFELKLHGNFSWLGRTD